MFTLCLAFDISFHRRRESVWLFAYLVSLRLYGEYLPYAPHKVQQDLALSLFAFNGYCPLTVFPFAST